MDKIGRFPSGDDVKYFNVANNKLREGAAFVKEGAVVLEVGVKNYTCTGSRYGRRIGLGPSGNYISSPPLLR